MDNPESIYSDMALDAQKNNILDITKIFDDIKTAAIKDDSIWDEYPVDIGTFIDDPYYLNLKDYIYPEIKNILKTVFDGEPLKYKYDEVLIIAGIGCHAKGTKVILSNGMIERVELIRPGDRLMGPDSTPRTVKSLIRSSGKMYKIIPNKGKSFIVNGNHILSLKRTNRYKDDKLGKKIVNISVNDYLKLSKSEQRVHKLYRTGIDFFYKDVTLDSYYLGLWLGDGNSHNTGITTNDFEIVEYLNKFAAKLKLKVVPTKSPDRCITYNLTSGKRIGGKNRNALLNELRKYNLIKNKHIPFEYKTNTRDIRLSVLAGLIDSDGYKSNTGYEITSKYKELADDILYLARSLGYAAYISNKKVKIHGKFKTYYRIFISGNMMELPIKIERKKPSERKQNKDVLVTGFKIEQVDDDNYYGFELDGDKLYLLDDFTVTHNSGKSYFSAVAITYLTYILLCLKNPQKYFGLDPSTRITIINMARHAKQALKVVFSEIKSKIDNSKWFKLNAKYNPKVKSELQFFDKNIYIIPGNSNENFPLGYAIFASVIDEMAFFAETEDKDVAEEIYTAVSRRIHSRFKTLGMIFMITSPSHDDAFVEKLAESAPNKPKMFYIRKPVWEIKNIGYSGEKFWFNVPKRRILLDKPKKITNEILTIPIEYLKDFELSPEHALKDHAAYPLKSIESYIKATDKIEKAFRIDPTNFIDDNFKISPNLRADEYSKYTIHIDLAYAHDSCGFAMGHVSDYIDILDEFGEVVEKKPKIKIDLAVGLSPNYYGEIQFSDIRGIIFQLVERGFNLDLVTLDGFQSVDTLQILDSRGINAERLSVDKTMEPYETFKLALMEERVSLPHTKQLEEELKGLQIIKNKKVDHKKIGSKDVSDAVCGVVYNLARNEGDGVISFGFLEN